MTTDRDSIWTMVRQPDLDPGHPEANQLVASWQTDDGLLCAVLRIRNAHYTGYVQLPRFVKGCYGGDWPHEYDISHLWRCHPYGGITYGPDKTGWVGFDMNHGPEDKAYDGEGNPLPNCLWFDDHYADRPRFGGEDREWNPTTAEAEVQEFADCLADKLWALREGEMEGRP